MSPEKAIYEFLTQGDNLATAMEMSQYVEDLKLDMHRRFWNTFNLLMDSRVRNSDGGKGWKFTSFNLKHLRTDWEKSVLTSVMPSGSNQSKLQFVFAQANSKSNYRLYWGVCWSTPPKDFSSSSLTTLQAVLMKKGISISEPPKWIYWNYYKYQIYEAGFLVRLYHQTNEIVTEIIEDVWALFAELRPLLETINQEVNPVQ